MREMKESGIVEIGLTPSSWKRIQLEHCANIIRGGSPRPIDQYMSNDNIGYSWIKIGDTEKGNKYITNVKEKIIAAGLSKTRYVQKGTLLLTNSMSFGEPYILQVDGCIHDGWLAFSNLRFIDKEFLYYLLSSYACRVQFERASDGGVVQNLNIDKVKHSIVYYPDFYIQNKIASFLDSKCSKIDSLAADIQAQIDTLEQYKRSVITEAVTKGLDENVLMKDSGIPWIPLVPEHWTVYRIADLYEDRNERGNETLPLLSVSINSGVSDRELSDEEQERVFLRSEDKTKYKRVYPGDITYNMMRAWQGALGAVRVDGMVSPAYVVAKQTGIAEIDSRYIEALLRSPMGIEEMNRYSYGIMDFRKRLYWPQFRIIKICLPDIEEQRRIADYIDKKSQEIDSIIATKNEQLSVLADYKKSLIYEYVTGKKEVPNE